MYVPAGNGPFAREVRFHELLHVKYSPDGCEPVEGITQASILAAEDCRVNLLGALIRPHDALGTAPMPDAIQLATSKTERDMARLTAACLGYTSAETWCDGLREAFNVLARTATLPDWLRSHAAKLENAIYTTRHEAPEFIDLEVPSFGDAIRLARWLDETFNDGAPGPGKGSDKGENDGYDDAADGEGGNAENARWGEMKIVTPPLTVNHSTAMGRRTSASQQGARIQHFNRLVTGEIFGRNRKRATPDAVLIDNSGSMGWNASKLHEIVKQIPVGIVASYDGSDGQGELKILARDGRMVAESEVEAAWGGNEVDGPALRWLAQQSGRKVWVSDQGVCSDVCDDEAALAADCDATVKAAGIRVCLTTDPKAIMRTLRGR